MSLRAVFGSIAQTAASALGSVSQTQTQTSTTRNGQATGAQADEALRQMISKQVKPSVFEEQVKLISPDVVARRNVFDKPVTVTFDKPAREMTKAEYDTAFARAVLKRVGMPDATEREVGKFMANYAQATGGRFGFIGSEKELRALQGTGNEMRAHTSDYGLAVADAGTRQIHADRAELKARVEQARREAQSYGEEALAGFYKLQANGMINTVNDATKIVGVGELPKFEVSGEYWQDKKGFAEKVTTIGAAVVTGGASLPSDLLLIGSATGNMVEAAKGTDLRTGEQLSTTDRVLRGAGGVAGAYAVRGTVDDITQAVESQVKNLKPPTGAMEAVTAEGVRLPMNVGDDALTATNIEARAAKDISGRRNVAAHEVAGGHTVEKHVGKSEAWLRNRLESDASIRGFASSFRNEAAANRVQGQFVKQYKAEIDVWLKSGRHDFRGKVTMNEPIGIIVESGKSGAVETNKAFLMLVRDKSPQGWHVHTSYPVVK